jgi:hypothetical protein
MWDDTARYHTAVSGRHVNDISMRDDAGETIKLWRKEERRIQATLLARSPAQRHQI